MALYTSYELYKPTLLMDNKSSQYIIVVHNSIQQLSFLELNDKE